MYVTPLSSSNFGYNPYNCKLVETTGEKAIKDAVHVASGSVEKNLNSILERESKLKNSLMDQLYSEFERYDNLQEFKKLLEEYPDFTSTYSMHSLGSTESDFNFS